MAARILVVDDDPDIVGLMRLHLSSAGYEVRTAQDGIEAGYMVLAEAPDLIISDVSMPNMDGIAFVSALRADTTQPHIPVIFLTSAEDEDSRVRELGAEGYLTKPVRADHLLSMVARHVAPGASRGG
ncbi:MAG: response regulator [Burkholderiales bacterium]